MLLKEEIVWYNLYIDRILSHQHAKSSMVFHIEQLGCDCGTGEPTKEEWMNVCNNNTEEMWRPFVGRNVWGLGILLLNSDSTGRSTCWVEKYYGISEQFLSHLSTHPLSVVLPFLISYLILQETRDLKLTLWALFLLVPLLIHSSIETITIESLLCFRHFSSP